MGRKSIPAIPDNAVLRKTELCQALDIGEDLLERLVREGVIPAVYLSTNAPRFIYGQVVQALTSMATRESHERSTAR